MKHKGSKPCPHCSKAISFNKELCFAGFQEYGTLANFEASRVSKAIEMPVEAETVAEAPVKKKRAPRKPKDESVVIKASEETPKKRAPRKKLKLAEAAEAVKVLAI